MADEELLVNAIRDSTSELDKAREVVRDLANDLADVADVIEPVLEGYGKRIRASRMTIVSECEQTSAALKAFVKIIMDPSVLKAIEQSERLLKAMNDLEQFRLCGGIDAYLRAFGAVDRT